MPAGLFYAGLQLAAEITQLILSLFLGPAVTLLQLAGQVLAMAFSDVQVIIGQVAPTLLDATIDLLPLAFDYVSINLLVLVVEWLPGLSQRLARFHGLLSDFQRFGGYSAHTFDLAGLGNGQITFGGAGNNPGKRNNALIGFDLDEDTAQAAVGQEGRLHLTGDPGVGNRIFCFIHRLTGGQQGWLRGRGVRSHNRPSEQQTKRGSGHGGYCEMLDWLFHK